MKEMMKEKGQKINLGSKLVMNEEKMLKMMLQVRRIRKRRESLRFPHILKP